MKTRTRRALLRLREVLSDELGPAGGAGTGGGAGRRQSGSVTGEMEHAEARELLELAAVEPDGFDRLAAGDTPEASALAGHLAGCPECSAELERLRRASLLIRDAVRSAAPPELRERTLAFVAAVGRDRSAIAVAPAGAPVAVAVATAEAATRARDAEPARHRRRPPAEVRRHRPARHVGRDSSRPAS